MTPEPQSIILQKFNFTPQNFDLDDKIDLLTKNTLEIPKAIPKSQVKKTLKKNKIDFINRKKSIETHFSQLPMSVVMNDKNFMNKRKGSMANKSKPPISPDHSSHNQRKYEIFQGKLESQNSHLVNSTVHNLLTGEGNEQFDQKLGIFNNEEVSIYEDIIYKHKPGLKSGTFLPKWVRITNKAVYLFKDQFSANLWNAKPHITIPLALIARAQKINFTQTNHNMRGREADWEQYQYKLVVELDLERFGIKREPMQVVQTHKCKLYSKIKKPVDRGSDDEQLTDNDYQSRSTRR